jgi:hypothetical protein
VVAAPLQVLDERCGAGRPVLNAGRDVRDMLFRGPVLPAAAAPRGSSELLDSKRLSVPAVCFFLRS